MWCMTWSLTFGAPPTQQTDPAANLVQHRGSACGRNRPVSLLTALIRMIRSSGGRRGGPCYLGAQRSRLASVDGLAPKMTTAGPVCKRVNRAGEIVWISTDTQGCKVLGERSFEPRAPG
jgi:hypothetical protein